MARTCCNPLKKAKHKNVSKNVKVVTDKWDPIFRGLIEHYICDSCRRAIAKTKSVISEEDLTEPIRSAMM